MLNDSIQIALLPEQRRTLDLEVRRLESLGFKTNKAQVIRILIEQHRLKLRLTAEEDSASDTLVWLWRKKNGEAD